MKKIGILGAGAWGTAVATLLAHNGYDVVVWSYEADVVDQINHRHVNERFLPGIVLHDRIRATNDSVRAVEQADLILEATPVAFLRKTLESFKKNISPSTVWGVLSKGIEQDSFLLPTEIIDEVFSPLQLSKVVISGPSFAYDMAKQAPTALVVAASDNRIAQSVSEMLANEYCFPFLSEDVIGVQVCGALKNLVTVGVGLVSEARCGDNTRALVFTKGLQELSTLVEHWGGEARTIMGFAGVGDLVLTAMGQLSRNLKLGMLLGSGIQMRDMHHHFPVLPEGANTIQAVEQVRKKYRLTLPFCHALYRVLYEQATIKDFLSIYAFQEEKPDKKVMKTSL
jgi:glycerol-3-phosphate dehydrogenase (NAD(P)+)